MKCWVKPMFGVQSITKVQGDILQVSTWTGKLYLALKGHGMFSLGQPTALAQEISVMFHNRQESLSEPVHRSLGLCLALASRSAFCDLLYM